MRRDIVFALRRLGQAPAFTIFSIVTLALGIGATTAIYSVIHAVLLLPPSVSEADRLVNIYSSPDVAGSLPVRGFSLPDYEDLRTEQTSLSGLSAWSRFRQVVIVEGSGEIASGEMVGGDYFSLLDVSPLAGRLIRPEDDQPGAAPVVVLSERVWRRRFRADPAAIGRTLKIAAGAFEIVASHRTRSEASTSRTSHRHRCGFR